MAKFYGIMNARKCKAETLVGVVKGYVTKKSDMTIKGQGTREYMRFSVNVLNQTKSMDWIAKEVGATANHYESGENKSDVLTVVAFGREAQMIDKRKVQPGDEVTLLVDFEANEYNENVSVQGVNASLIDVRHRGTTDADSSEASEPVMESTLEFSEEDLPF